MRRLSPPRPSFAVVLLCAAATFGYLSWRQRQVSRQSEGSESVAARAEQQDAVSPNHPTSDQASGDRLLDEVFVWLERRPNIEARVRQRIRFQGQEVVGSGGYWQRGVDRQRSTRWELQTHVGDGIASFVQVLVDGRYLWTDRRHGDDRRVTRLDLGDLRSGLLRQLPPGEPNGVADVQARIVRVRGGLSQLITSLRQQFEFKVSNTTDGDSQRWITLVGKWRPSALDEHWANLSADSPVERWPEQLPHRVVLKLGRRDLFPYTIAYVAVDSGMDAGATSTAPTDAVLAEYEFFQVRFDAAIPDRRFDFAPGEDWTDVTQQVVRRLSPHRASTVDVASLLKRRELRR